MAKFLIGIALLLAVAVLLVDFTQPFRHLAIRCGPPFVYLYSSQGAKVIAVGLAPTTATSPWVEFMWSARTNEGDRAFRRLDWSVLYLVGGGLEISNGGNTPRFISLSIHSAIFYVVVLALLVLLVRTMRRSESGV